MENKKIAVHVPTQEDWTKVITKFRSNYYNAWNVYKKNICITIPEGTFCNFKHYVDNDYKIISVKEFFKNKNSEKLFGELSHKHLTDIIKDIIIPSIQQVIEDFENYSTIEEDKENKKELLFWKNILKQINENET